MPARPHPSLETLQRWLQAVISHPGGAAAGMAGDDARAILDVPPDQVEQVIGRSHALGSLERLAIYGGAYYARLIGCLEEMFPALRQAVGADTFAQFAAGYLERYPSRSYTLDRLGGRLAEYLAETRPERLPGEPEVDWPELLVDLARLETAVYEVFDGPGVEGERLLSPADLADVSPERWLDARLQTVPCLRLLVLRFPLHGYFSALRRGEDPPPPAAAPSWLALSRTNFTVRRWPLSEFEHALLTALAGGATIGDALTAAAETSELTDEALAAQVKSAFARWTEAGFFQSIYSAGP